MVNRYGYTWEYLQLDDPTTDGDGNPIAPIKVWRSFDCDVQTTSGNFVIGSNGDRIESTYSIFTKDSLGLVIGDLLKSGYATEHTILQIHDYKINFEIWV